MNDLYTILIAVAVILGPTLLLKIKYSKRKLRRSISYEKRKRKS